MPQFIRSLKRNRRLVTLLVLVVITSTLLHVILPMNARRETTLDAWETLSWNSDESSIFQDSFDVASSNETGNGIKAPVDCFHTAGMQHKCFLASYILVRIYEQDKARWNKEQLGQWIKYMFFAGASHVYLYDNYKTASESLRSWVKMTFAPSLVTYHDWSKYHPYTVTKTQIGAYEHALANYGKRSVWSIATDIDEYLFASDDTRRGFAVRKIQQLTEQYKHLNVTSFSIRNCVFVGQPSNASLVLQSQLRRIRICPSNNLDKTIFQSNAVTRMAMHHSVLAYGKSMDVDPKVLRNNHYWGARLQNWGEDTPLSLAKTIPDDSALSVAEHFKEYVQHTRFV